MIGTRGEALDKKEKKNKSIIEAGVVTFIMIFYIVYGIYFFPLLILFIPVPFIVLGVRNGIRLNILSIVLTLLIVEIILGNTMGASLVIVFAPLSIAINYCIKKRKNSKKTLLISSLALLIPIVILVVLEMKIADINLIDKMDNWFSEFITIQIDIFKEMGFTNNKILKIVDQAEGGYNNMVMLIPSLMSIFSVFVYYINYFFTGIILRKMGYDLIKRPSLSRYQLPKDVIMGAGVMLLTGFIFKWLDFQYNQALLLNLTFLIGVMFMIQGLAVLDFFLKRMKIKLVFRVILVALNIIIAAMGSLIIFVGLLDSVFDMRKLRRLKS